jgi:protocatechuate 3,4-dioxygenase beta subunit
MNDFPFLSRRGFVLGGTALLASPLRAADPGCMLTSQQEEGPYYVDDEVLRRDVTEGRPGLPLQLRIAIVDSRTCAPLKDAAVDIWHCDALGVYSGFTSNGGGENGFPGGPPGGSPARGDMTTGGAPPGAPPPGGRRGPGRSGGPRGPGGPGGMGGRGRGTALDDTRFLRGVQLTDARGAAEFVTIYPGWYQGRTIHIHLKVHVGGTAAAKYSGGHVAHTGQLFLPEDITADVAKMEPYSGHTQVHRTVHSEDHIFLHQGGSQALMQTARLQKSSNAGGFLATVTLAVDPTATPVVF